MKNYDIYLHWPGNLTDNGTFGSAPRRWRWGHVLRCNTWYSKYGNRTRGVFSRQIVFLKYRMSKFNDKRLIFNRDFLLHHHDHHHHLFRLRLLLLLLIVYQFTQSKQWNFFTKLFNKCSASTRISIRARPVVYLHVQETSYIKATETNK